VLDVIENHMSGGQAEAARQVLRDWKTIDCRDADLHLRLADYCEELGQADRLLEELNLAFRDSPQRYPQTDPPGAPGCRSLRQGPALFRWRSYFRKAPPGLAVTPGMPG